MAEIALAILPLCFQAMKLCKKAPGKLMTFRTYMNTVEESRLLLDVQSMAFLNECKHVLSEALRHSNQSEIRLGHLIEDDDHDGWSSTELDNSLQMYLGPSQEPFKLLLQLITQKLRELDDTLNHFDEIDETGKEGGSSSRRVGHRFRVVFNEESYEKGIEKVRKLISDLRGLRERAETETTAQRSTMRAPQDLPASYRIRRQDSALWLKVMKDKWSCFEQRHSSHSLKLLLADEHRGESRFDSILHRRQISDSTNAEQQDSMTQFCVQPQASQGSCEHSEQPHSKRQRKLSVDASHKPSLSSQNDKQGILEPEGSPQPADLTVCKDLCKHLSMTTQQRSEKFDALCMGFVESRHRIFRIFATQKTLNYAASPLPGKLVAIQEIFHTGIDDTIHDPQRFWLASLVVRSALQHHNTFWWPENWTLDQLKFYDQQTGELIDSLRTLHLTAQLNSDHDGGKGKAKAQLESVPMDMKKAMTKFGIRNLTLWCIGVALLQIGLWRPIRWDDHEEVRESVGSLERVSKQYYEITDKLINCDFGAGANLQNPKLQNEVYRHVVCELDDIMDEFRVAGI